MSLNILAHRRNALIFAGGVVACATLATSNMGSQYSPDSEQERDQNVASAPVGDDSRSSAANRQSRSVAYSSNSESVFGAYGENEREIGFGEDLENDPDFDADDALEDAGDPAPSKPVMRPATAQIRPVAPGNGSANPLQTVMDGETSLAGAKKRGKKSGQ